MDKFIDSPWFLRLTALVLALILFFSVRADLENKSKSASGETIGMLHDVPVEVFYDSDNLVVTGVPDTIDVTIEGPANIVQTTKLLKDFTAILDLTNLPLGEHYVNVRYENISDKLTVRSEPSRIQLTIEEKITATFGIEAELNKQAIDASHYVKSIQVEPKEVQITGAKSIVEAIEYVKVSVDVEKGTKESFQQKARVRVLDKDLNKLDVHITPEEVNVAVELDEYSKEVPIRVQPEGEPPEGVTIQSVQTLSRNVTIFGAKREIESVEEVVAQLDVSNITASGVTEAKLIVPDHVTKVTPETIQVQVTATTNGTQEPSPPQEEEEPSTSEQDDVSARPPMTPPSQEESSVTLAKVPVKIEGLDTKYSAHFVQPTSAYTDVTVHGLTSKLNELKNTDFTVYIDASSIHRTGNLKLPIQVAGLNGMKWQLKEEEVTLLIEEVHVSKVDETFEREKMI